MSAKSLYEEQAAAWDRRGRHAEDLESYPRNLTALRCWVASDGAKREGISEVLVDFKNASVEALDRAEPDWYDDFLATRGHCDRCYERYRLENLALCTKCDGTVCHACIGSSFKKAANGNYQHCAEGELVG